jgi:DNA-binding NarL/FixJ family response regulator
VIEDEALVALALAELLIDLGFEVVGPFSNLTDGGKAAALTEIDAAILDVNVNGQMIYSVAEELLRRGLPFAFVTGYGAESIDTRFRHVPVLQKPVERERIAQLFAKPALSRKAASKRSA